MRTIGLYIHIPFCHTKCPYCAYYKEVWSPKKDEEIVEALCKELTYYKTHYPPLQIDTLFIGGGTPTSLAANNLKTLLKKIHSTFKIGPDFEGTSEANPDSLTQEFLDISKDYSLNRISLGVQSFQEKDLHFLGRTHSLDTIDKAITRIKKDAYWDLNIDLMFGLPTTTVNTVIDSLKQTLAYNPEHISTYALSIEPNTPFKHRGVTPVNSELELRQYHAIQDHLKKVGYNHYEISAFAKPSKECKHNLRYWSYQDYIGIGPSANSFFNNHRYTNPSSIADYCQHPHPDLGEPLSEQDQKTEYIIAHLRQLRPFSMTAFDNQFNSNFRSEFESQLNSLATNKLLTLSKNNTSFELTQNGINLLNTVLLEFIPS